MAVGTMGLVDLAMLNMLEAMIENWG